MGSWWKRLAHFAYPKETPDNAQMMRIRAYAKTHGAVGPDGQGDPNLLSDKDWQALKREDKQAITVNAGGSGGGNAVSDVKESVEGMKEGTVPPVMPGRASKEYVAIMAEIYRQHFDIAKANEDWTATQKYLGTTGQGAADTFASGDSASD